MNNFEFWHKCWEESNTRWNLGGPHYLTSTIFAKLSQLGIAPIRTAYVPGCGHGHDAAYFADQGLEVLATDISPLAIKNAQTLYQKISNLRFNTEDVFNRDLSEDNRFDMVFDRAVLCAFSSEYRPAYVEACWHKLKIGGVLATIPFTKVSLAADKSGPPFSMDVDEVRKLLDSKFSLLYAEEFDEPSLEGVIQSEAIMIWRKL